MKIIENKNSMNEKKKLGYDLNAQRNLWEVNDSDWLETQHRQWRRKVY